MLVFTEDDSGFLRKTVVSGGTDSVSQTLPPIMDACADHGRATEDGRVCVNDDLVLYGRVALVPPQLLALILSKRKRPEGDSLVDTYPVSDDSRFTYDHPGSVVDEEALPDLHGRMDVYARLAVGVFAHHSGDQGPSRLWSRWAMR